MELISLNESYPEACSRLNKTIEKIKDPEMLKHYIGFLTLDNIDVALYKIYIENDFEFAKNCFYKSSLCDAYKFIIYDRLMHTSIYSICYSLISDSEYSINLYKNLINKTVNEKFIGYYFNTAIQAILKDDDALLSKQIFELEKETINKKWVTFKGLVDVFKGIQNKNKNQVEAGLQELLKTHKKRDGHEFIKKYFSIEVTALAKLAWRVGIEVNINNSLVPNEILPIKELKNYDDYDFFKELIDKN
jgi:hypothetical protein